MVEYKWYLHWTEGWSQSYQETFDTKEEAEDFLSHNYDSDCTYTLVLGQEYKFSSKVKIEIEKHE